MSNFVNKIVLYKMRNILIKEMKKGYYQNAANIKSL